MAVYHSIIFMLGLTAMVFGENRILSERVQFNLEGTGYTFKINVTAQPYNGNWYYPEACKPANISEMNKIEFGSTGNPSTSFGACGDGQAQHLVTSFQVLNDGNVVATISSDHNTGVLALKDSEDPKVTLKCQKQSGGGEPPVLFGKFRCGKF